MVYYEKWVLESSLKWIDIEGRFKLYGNWYIDDWNMIIENWKRVWLGGKN